MGTGWLLARVETGDYHPLRTVGRPKSNIEEGRVEAEQQYREGSVEERV